MKGHLSQDIRDTSPQGQRDRTPLPFRGVSVPVPCPGRHRKHDVPVHHKGSLSIRPVKRREWPTPGCVPAPVIAVGVRGAVE